MRAINKSDLIILGVIAIIIIASFTVSYFSNAKVDNNKLVAYVKVDSKVIREIDLYEIDNPYEFDITGKYTNTIRVEKKRIRFVKSDCPNKICVNTGWLEKPGDVAVCLPNKTVITVRGKEDEIDITVQ